MASIPVPSLALTMMGSCLQLTFICSANSVVLGRTSALFRINMTGMPCSFNRWSHSCSCASPVSQSNRAMSVFPITFNVRSTRISPSSPSSSNPGVSIRRHGPSGWISIAFVTGSVVVPGVGETITVSCPVKALTRLDFPLFRRPKRAMCRRLALGVWFISLNIKGLINGDLIILGADYADFTD